MVNALAPLAKTPRGPRFIIPRSPTGGSRSNPTAAWRSCSDWRLLYSTTACMDPDDPGNLVPATVDEDPSPPRIEVNGTTLHAEAFGDPSAPP